MLLPRRRPKAAGANCQGSKSRRSSTVKRSNERFHLMSLAMAAINSMVILRSQGVSKRNKSPTWRFSI
jgi:hypothetical protein